MDDVKTYLQVNQADANLSFGISRMEDIHEKRKGQPDAPHRHDFYTILIIKEGDGTHQIDFNSYQITANQVYFIGPGQVHQLNEKKKSIGYSLVFAEQFLTLNNISSHFIADINLFHGFEDTPPLLLDAVSISQLEAYAEQIHTQYVSDKPFKFEAIGALLKLLLITAHRHCTLHRLDTQTMASGGTLLRNFKKMIDEEHLRWHHTTSYAEALNISPDHLNRVVKSLTGKTAKEHLQSRITLAAKHLLFFTGLSTKEIAYKLGFSEPSNFSAFFKKCTGLSPKTFRKKV
ncbi:MAG: helix-turn-helix transcriptional regulator [Bacteroidota bacterium]